MDREVSLHQLYNIQSEIKILYKGKVGPTNLLLQILHLSTCNRAADSRNGPRAWSNIFHSASLMDSLVLAHWSSLATFAAMFEPADLKEI